MWRTYEDFFLYSSQMKSMQQFIVFILQMQVVTNWIN